MATTRRGVDLAVRAENIAEVYRRYLDDLILVNRRYQRKLVWTVEEKQRLVDSVMNDLPIPLFLVAETNTEDQRAWELIDGMQRMNAIVGFIEQEFDFDGAYFDLAVNAYSKIRADEEQLVQKEPRLPQDACADFLNYQLALSVFRARSPEQTEEVFRRINASGKRLSRQELRQAGSTSRVSDAVRLIASRIRGDTSSRDSLALSKMPSISISNEHLDYSVDVDEIFWVKASILRRADVRDSQDEQLILDIIIDILVFPLVGSSVKIRDAAYTDHDGSSFPNEIDDDADSLADEPQTAGANDRSEASSVQEQIQASLRTGDDLERLIDRFMLVQDVCERAFAGSTLPTLLGLRAGSRYPRYYQVIFLAIYELNFVENKSLRDEQDLISALSGIAGPPNPALSVPGGGGTFRASPKRTAIDAVKGIIAGSFEPREGPEDFALRRSPRDLEMLLRNGLSEQQLFEFKQGFLTLNPHQRSLNEGMFETIGRTATAMANAGPDGFGHFLVGLADDADDAAAIASLDSIAPVERSNRFIVGLEREARIRRQTVHEYWDWLLQKIAQDQRTNADLRNEMVANARLIPYHGLFVGVLRVGSPGRAVHFDDRMYERQGSSTVEVGRDQEYRVHRRFENA